MDEAEVARLEDGERSPFSFEVAALVQATGQPASWFLASGQSPLEALVRAEAERRPPLAGDLNWLADLVRDTRLLRDLLAQGAGRSSANGSDD